ncbi:MAG: DegT/DnrJ/EryC1/StrS family aminotransferase [Candidatus Latescibacteria bacterium]|jgi:dTDP-4-amino-4,6-dideoxygalactose transaminase|nr:DegT/DnrJ/EryC1/StrS family aminotransferase [Candidatus Latescibacterota bacterium]MBT4138316.1 DegT/DnrJ/EryC1/StrS family aminotransferase [Candidatus Latescibacterota bacterium]
MREDFLVFGRPQIEEDEIAEVVATLRSGWIGTGPKTTAFEEAFRTLIGAKYAISVGSCTAALHLSMLVSGIKPGDEVITTPMTFCATANAITHVGAKPIFVDINPKTLNIDPDQIECAITDKTRAIIPVHFAGRPCDMQKLTALAKKHNLMLIEDAAHAIESDTPQGKIGTIGDLTCFSFYVTKNITTAEGGMITTNNAEWAEKLKIYALHGLSHDAWKRYSDSGFKHYEVQFPGFKYNMTDLQASLGLHQIKRVDKNLKRRESIWRRYDEAFQNLPIKIPAPTSANTIHARHLYTILIDVKETKLERDAFQHELFKRNIGTGIHYTSVHLQPYYRDVLNYQPGQFPAAEYISDRTLSLPLGPSMNDQDVEDVIEAVHDIFKTRASVNSVQVEIET